MTESGRVVAVTGGTGFLGRRIVALLVERGATVRMLARRPWASGIPRGPGVVIVAGKLEDVGSLVELATGASVVIHSAAMLGSIDRDELHRTNVDGTRHMLEAAQKASIDRFVHVSSIAAKWRAGGLYGGSKKAAEEVVEASDLPWVMLRPPVILGPGSQVEAKVLAFARFGIVPTVAGSGRMYPVHVDDVAQACVEAAFRPGVCGRRYELPGPEPLTLPQMQRRTLASAGRRALVMPIPPAALKVVSDLVARATGRTPLGSDVIDAITKGVDMDGTDAARDLGFSPRRV
jgi:nucleoside-diphosphate-sugar epimerase